MISRWKEALMRNIVLRLLAVLLAISTWSWVQINEEASLLQKVSIEYILPPDLIESSELPKAVLVEISGAKGLIKSLENINLSTKLDLSDGVLGENHIELSTQPIAGIPEGVSITRYTPPSIDVDLDQPILRELLVRPNIVGSPKSDWRISKIEVVPKTLTIRGPRKLLNSVSEVSTQVIDINGVDSPIEFQVGLSLPSNVLSTDQKNKIAVNILVEMEMVEQNYPETKIILGNDTVQLNTETVALTLRVPKLHLGTLKTPPILKIQEDILSLSPLGFEYSPATKQYFSVQGLPQEGLEIISIQPSTFTIKEGSEE